MSARGEVEGGAWSRFAATFLVRAESAYNRRYGADVRQGLDALERDYDNLLSIATMSEPTDPTIAAKVALCLAWLIGIRRPAEPRLETLEKLVSIVPGDQLTVLSQLRTALSAACLDLWTRTGAKLDGAVFKWAEQAIEAGRTSGDDTVLAEAHRALALVASRSGDLERAAAAFETAIEHFMRARQFAAAAAVYAKWASVPASGAHNGKPIEANVDKVSEAKRLIGKITNPIIRFGILNAELSLWQQSQTPPSVDMRKLTNELRELAKEVESTEMMTRSLHATAVVESGLDDQDRALAALQEKAALQRTSGSTLALGLTTSDMAAVTLRRRPLTDDNLDTAIRLLDEALHLAKDRGLEREMAILHGNRSWALLNRGRSQEALADSAMTVGFFGELLNRVHFGNRSLAVRT